MDSAPRVGDSAPHFVRDPVFGRAVDTRAAAPVTVVFLRGVAWARTRRTARALLEVWDALDTAGVGLVAVVPGQLQAARDFVPRLHLRYPVVSDPDGDLASAWGVGHDVVGLRALGASLGSTALYAAGGGRGGLGPMGRRSAAFVVGADGRIAWLWRGRHAGAEVPVSALRDAALGHAASRDPLG